MCVEHGPAERVWSQMSAAQVLSDAGVLVTVLRDDEVIYCGDRWASSVWHSERVVGGRELGAVLRALRGIGPVVVLDVADPVPGRGGPP